MIMMVRMIATQLAIRKIRTSPVAKRGQRLTHREPFGFEDLHPGLVTTRQRPLSDPMAYQHLRPRTRQGAYRGTFTRLTRLRRHEVRFIPSITIDNEKARRLRKVS